MTLSYQRTHSTCELIVTLAEIRPWDPSEWEDYVNRLLSTHHGPSNYQRIPATHGGDYGIESYSTDGCVYQCYVADGAYSTKDLHERQRDKITTDLGKFVRNSVELATILRPASVCRWVLMVPRFESAQTVAHCCRKAEEVRTHGLSYLTSDFQVLIHTDEDYPEARRRLFAPILQNIPLAPVDPGDGTVEDWVSANSQLVKVLGAKLEVLPQWQDQDHRDDLIASFLRSYISGQDLLDHLLRSYPDIYQAVMKIRSARQDRLAISSLGRPAANVLSRELEDLRNDLLRIVGDGSDDVATRLALHALSDWLMRCPLRFAA